MTYSELTDDYENDFFENILDTDFKYDVPYRIDKEKYFETIEKDRQLSRINDADIVTFRTSYSINNDGDIEQYAFFAFPENSPKDSQDFYDCFLFSSLDDDNFKEKYKDLIHKVLGCVIEVDKEGLKKIREKLLSEKQDIDRKIKEVDDMLCEDITCQNILDEYRIN